jgi:lysophospholipid acyltransferase (LPLAT)-like uncharacterized protein
VEQDQAPGRHFDTRLPELSRWRRMQVPVIAWAVYWVVRIIGTTIRYERVGESRLDSQYKTGRPIIWVFWHNTSIATSWLARDRGIVVLNSTNFDGQWTRRVVERLGFGTAQGSSTRGGLSGLQALEQCLKEGRDVAFTIDGPLGPRYVAKPGPVLLARRSGCPICIMQVALEKKTVLRKTWDLFQIPHLFTRAVALGEGPIAVPPDADREMIDRKVAEMQAALDKSREAAEQWFKLAPEEQERERMRRA